MTGRAPKSPPSVDMQWRGISRLGVLGSQAWGWWNRGKVAPPGARATKRATHGHSNADC